MKKKAYIFFVLLLFVLPFGVHAQKIKNLAQTPPMGWNSWNHFGCNVSEQLIKQTADAMVASGMRDAGYEYIIIDDCWQGKRDSLGRIHPDPDRFPSGMKALANYVHSKGLKLGIYSDAGARTCAGYPGSRGHQYQDARTYAKWGIDYLKYDWCHTEGLNAKSAYTTMRNALYSAGRPIVFSICEWGTNEPWKWAEDIGNLWRTTGDITNCWACDLNHGGWKSFGVLSILDKQDGLRKYAGPGHWNDPDMLEVGNGMSVNKDRGHFSMWAMLAAPLIAGNDLGHMSDQTQEILTNKEVIAVDQDTLGIQGFDYKDMGDLEIWFKPLSGGDWAMCILNRGSRDQEVKFDWSQEYVSDGLSERNAHFDNTTYRLRDLWEHKNIGTTRKPLDVTVPKNDVLMLRLQKQ